MNARDFTKFHTLVEQFSGKMTLAGRDKPAGACRQLTLHLLEEARQPFPSAPEYDIEGMIEIEVTDMPPPAMI